MVSGALDVRAIRCRREPFCQACLWVMSFSANGRAAAIINFAASMCIFLAVGGSPEM